MRKLLGIAVAAAFAIGMAAPANAATVPFTGALYLQIGTLPAIPAPGGGVATINGSGGLGPITSLALPAGAFATSLVAPVPNAFPIIQIALPTFANGPINLAAGGGCTAGHANVSCPGTGLAGFGGIQGTAFVGVFSTHGPGSTVLPVANLAVPLAVAGGGSTVTTVGLGIYVKVSGAGWTTGTANVYNPTAPNLTHLPYTIHNPLSVFLVASSSVPYGYGSTATFMGSGTTMSGAATDTLTLVSPVQIFNTATGAFIPSLASITIHLVPEPGTLLLLGSGIAGLALYGRRRMRK